MQTIRTKELQALTARLDASLDRVYGLYMFALLRGEKEEKATAWLCEQWQVIGRQLYL